MSQSTPAKQQRIERHLIRQRGAGVRSIAASFGFSLPSSSSSRVVSSDATAAHHEPPPKKRKTIVEPIPTETNREDAPATLTKVATVKKVRKRFQVEEEVEGPTGGDDSFVFGQRKKEKKRAADYVVATFNAQHPTASLKNKALNPPKKSRSKKHDDTVTDNKSTEMVVVKQPPQGRPKRGAATVAAVKVADSLEEENVPVDNKRRNASPAKNLKARQMQAVETSRGNEEIPGGPTEDNVVLVKLLKCRKRKAAAMAEGITEAQQDPEESHPAREENGLLKSSVAVKTKGKRRRFNQPREPPLVHGEVEDVQADVTAASPTQEAVMPPQKCMKRKARKELDCAEEGRTKRVKRRTRADDQPVVVEQPVSAVQTTVKPTKRQMVADTRIAEPGNLTGGLRSQALEPDAESLAEDQPARSDQRSKPQSRQIADEHHSAESLEYTTPPLEPPQAEPSLRRPLVDTDINVTMRSKSPEKPIPCPTIPHSHLPNKEDSPSETSSLNHRRPDKRNPHRPSPPTKQGRQQNKPSQRSTSQDKPVQSRHLAPISTNVTASDDLPIVGNASDTAMTRIAVPAGRVSHQQGRRGGSRSASETQNCGAKSGSGNAVSATDAETLAHGPGKVPREAREPKRGRGQGWVGKCIGDKVRENELGGEEAGVDEKGSADSGEDVDCLFNAPEASRASRLVKKKPRKKTAAPSVRSGTGSKGRAKIVDIDLDDLISNIASFAQQERQAAQTSMPKSRTKRHEL